MQARLLGHEKDPTTYPVLVPLALVVHCHRLNRKNFIIVVAERHPGFRWDANESMFVRDNGPGSTKQAQGTGFSMAQVC